ncbi:MAG: ribonuclease Z [Oscillospiraceae bacterium]|nr:ribonuclease Z [Oscillospiraceae bacterium]
MNVITIVDDDNGLLFHHRRLSQDRLLRDYILHMIGDRRLWMNDYGSRLYGEHPNIVVSESYLTACPAEDYCLVEEVDPATIVDRIDRLYLFHWNRLYPSDLQCTLCLEHWTLEHTDELKGSSHKKITLEVYKKHRGKQS